MRTLDCAHCGKPIIDEDNGIDAGDKNACPHCGMPLPPNKRKSPQKKFILWFIAIVIFCFLMMYFLPFLGSSRNLGH